MSGDPSRPALIFEEDGKAVMEKTALISVPLVRVGGDRRTHGNFGSAHRKSIGTQFATPAMTGCRRKTLAPLYSLSLPPTPA